MFLVINKDAFGNWLQRSMDERGLSQSDLARLSGLNRAVVSKVLNRDTEPTVSTIEALARGLKLPPEQVFLAAIESISAREEDPRAKEAAHLVGLLPEERKQQVVDYIRFMVQAEESKEKRK